MGCGTGILGISAAISGASSVHFIDINDDAIHNTYFNVDNILTYRHNFRNMNSIDEVLDNADMFESNLFSGMRYQEQYDVIIFNKPFFFETPDPKVPISRTMFSGKRMYGKYLRDAKENLKENGFLLECYYPFAGPENDPRVKGPKYGYDVEILKYIDKNLTMQKGEKFIAKLTPI